MKNGSRIDNMLTTRRRGSKDRGQSMLEFALMLPFLMLLAVGIVDVGRAIYYTIAVNNGAAAGAQYASISKETASPDNVDKVKATAVCDAANSNSSQFFWNSCTAGVLTADHVTVTSGCRCDTGSGPACNPMPLTDCTGVTCSGNDRKVECVQVRTTATFSTLIGWPGLPASYTANGNAVTEVRREQ